MDATALCKLIDELLLKLPCPSLKLYFSRWSASKYISFMPQLSSELQRELMTLILTSLRPRLADNIVEYNPIGVADDEIEKIQLDRILQVQSFFDSIADDKIIKEMSALKTDKIDFYCVEICFGNQRLLMFRQFQKLKKLRKGLLTRIVNNELQIMDSDFLGIDEVVDIVILGDEVFLINHISLERIFKYKDEFLKKTNEALGELLTKNIVTNIEQFIEDCCSDIRIMKRFTNIMTKGRLPLFFENYDKVSEIVQELGLDIDFDDNGKMIYRERSQLFHIINLLSDSYFRTLIADRTGVAKIEGDL